MTESDRAHNVLSWSWRTVHAQLIAATAAAEAEAGAPLHSHCSLPTCCFPVHQVRDYGLGPKAQAVLGFWLDKVDSNQTLVSGPETLLKVQHGWGGDV